MAADCCSASATGCPGAYPQNFACVEGLCRAPRCETNADCTFGATPACRTLGGLPSCVVDCSANADCVASGLAAGACTGQADDGAAICGLGSALCQSDADCLVPGMHCLDGVRCGCRDDADCASAAFPHCRAGTCSCAADAECGPGLDVCTTDRAFAYPPSAAPGP